MEIRHILKDGTILADITGHVVKMADAERAYTIMRKMSEEGRKTVERYSASPR